MASNVTQDTENKSEATSNKETKSKPTIKSAKNTLSGDKSPKPAKSATKSTKTTPTTSKKKPGKKESNSNATKLKTLSKFKRIPSATRKIEEEMQPDEVSLKEDEKLNEEYSLQQQLIPALKEISRQKLRSLKMALRKLHASSEDGFVSTSDTRNILSDLKIQLPSRLLDFLIRECETKEERILHEKLITFFEKAHAMSGRDSVEAIDAEEIDSGLRIQSEITEQDLYKRAETQLINTRDAFDLDYFKDTLKEMDKSHSGLLNKDEMEKVALEQNCPIYGSLLHSVLSKCDTSKTNNVRWPEFVNFIEKVLKEVLEKRPDHKYKFAKRQTIAKPLPTREILKNKMKMMADKAKSIETLEHSQTEHMIKMGKSVEQNGGKTEVSATTTTMAAEGTATAAATAVTSKVNGTSTNENENKKTVQVSNKLKSKTPFKSAIKNISKSPLPLNKSLKTANKNASQAAAKSEFGDNNISSDKLGPTEIPVDKMKVPATIEPLDSLSIDVGGGVNKIIWPSDSALEKNKSLNAADLPTNKLKIEWVYGYQGHDSLCNLRILSSGELTYYMERTVILLDFNKHVQRHYTEHTEEVTSLAVHSDGIVCATSQREFTNNSTKQWSVRIWRSDSLVTLYVLVEDITNGNTLGHHLGHPVYMQFSFLKNWIFVLDDSSNRTLSLWEIKGHKLASTWISREPVYGLCCSRTNENIVVTVGKEHIFWWEYLPHLAEIQQKFPANHRGFLKAKITLCVLVTLNNDMITGDSNGTVYVWKSGGNVVTNYIKHAHESFVISLCVYKSFLFTADKEGQISMWLLNKNLDKMATIMVPPGEGGVRTMLITKTNHDHPILIVGTTSNSILQLPLAHGEKILHPMDGIREFGMDGLSIAITQGHYASLDCISTHPLYPHWFVTAGRDSQICVFDVTKCLGIQKTSIKGHKYTAISWFIEDHIFLGTLEGRCIILAQIGLDLVEVFNKVVTSGQVSAVHYCENDQIILVGTLDGSLIKFTKENIDKDQIDTDSEEKEKWIYDSIQTPIFGIDFIQNGLKDGKCYLWLSNKTSGFCSYHCSTMELIQDSKTIKNINWSKCKSGVIPDIAGAWMTPLMTQEGVTSVSISESKEIVAMGTKEGKIAIYKYPCLQNDAYCHSNNVGKPVSCLMFVPSEEHLISVSGERSCIIQWKII